MDAYGTFERPEGIRESESDHSKWRFHTCILALILVSLTVNMQWFAATNTLPTVSADLGDAGNAQWTFTAYRIAFIASSLFSGALAEALGRKMALLSALVVFCAGCAINGAAPSMRVLIAGRSIQGFASGAMLNLPFIIIADLTPLDKRGLYNAILTVVFLFGGCLGPLLGGALGGHWRWLWWISLMLGGLSFMLSTCLDLKRPQGSIREKLAAVHWFGNAWVIAALVSLCLGLSFGGTVYAWTSAATLVPIYFGGIGLLAWFQFQSFLPSAIWKDRTSSIGYFICFASRLLADTMVTYIPLYFQVLGDSVLVAAVKLIVFNVFMDGGATLTGIAISWLGRYRAVIILGCICGCVGPFLLAESTSTSATAAWVVAFVFSGLSAGILEDNAPLFAVLAPVPPALNAQAISFSQLLHGMGSLSGQVAGAVMLQNDLKRQLPQAVRDALPPETRNQAAFGVISLLPDLDDATLQAVRQSYRDSFRLLWLVYTGLGAIQLVASLLIRDIPLHTETDARWDLSEELDS